MKLQILNQSAGGNSIGDILRNLLDDKKFYHLKFLMAYLNVNGLKYVKTQLERFYDRGGILEFILGIDDGITTYEALDYVKKRFPRAFLFLFHDQSRQIVFHPKVIIFEGQESLACLIGSANMTLGGLFTNFEIVSMLEIDKRQEENDALSILSIWDAYRNPLPPLCPAHLQEVTDEWLAANRIALGKETDQKARKRASGIGLEGFGKVKIKLPRLQSLDAEPKRRPKGRMKRHEGAKNERLYLEIMQETGAGGTQVQIPTEVISLYFHGELARPNHIRLSFGGSSFRDGYILHFPNNTHRISIRELAETPRHALLVFSRSKEFSNSYECRILTGRQYRNALRFCTRQTREGAKHWGVI